LRPDSKTRIEFYGTIRLGRSSCNPPRYEIEIPKRVVLNHRDLLEKIRSERRLVRIIIEVL